VHNSHDSAPPRRGAEAANPVPFLPHIDQHMEIIKLYFDEPFAVFCCLQLFHGTFIANSY